MSPEPKVSILLPNLNNREYLEARIRSIRDQTLKDWELIVVDSYSDDGAWEYFEECARKDKRIRIHQSEERGIYNNFNKCIRYARAEYIYFATSDDTMTPNALEEMVNALEENPGCDLAHCKLKIIDENGAPYPKLIWDKFYCSAFFGDLINQKHIRLAPHDGLLHCGVKTVYTSITQLLIRKSLFDRIGLFLTNYGSIADFEWEMRASLVANTIHIPAYLATWRVHHSQGTDQDFLHSSKYRTQLLKLIDHAFDKAKKKNPTLLKGIKKKELKAFYLTEKLRWEIKEQRRQANSKFYKYKTAFKWLLMKPKILLKYYRYSLAKSKNKQKAFNSLLEPLAFSRKLLRKYGFEDNIKIIN